MNQNDPIPARIVAETLRDQGQHVHYVSEGHAQCLAGRCITVVGP